MINMEEELKERIEKHKKMIVRFDLEPTYQPTPPYGYQGTGRNWNDLIIDEFDSWDDGADVPDGYYGYIRSDEVEAMIKSLLTTNNNKNHV